MLKIDDPNLVCGGESLNSPNPEALEYSGQCVHSMNDVIIIIKIAFSTAVSTDMEEEVLAPFGL